MQNYTFRVRGGHGDYDVCFTKEGSRFIATCSCKAGLSDMYCKHRFAIMAGDGSAVISDNTSQVAIIPSLLVGTDVEAAMRHIKDAEIAVAHAQAELSKYKKLLAETMQPVFSADQRIINITCTKCGSVIPKKLGWLKRNGSLICDCGSNLKINIKYE